MQARHPRQVHDIFGHQAAIDTFLASWHAGRLHHAWLITGPRGIGKASLAYAIAKWTMAPEKPEHTLVLPASNQTHKQVSNNSCPTLCVVEPEEDEKTSHLKEIGVDDARTIQPFLRLTAADDQWRVVLIDNADMLNTEAQNAILKILEEPPPRCLMLLTSSMPGRLLPTIRSRCRGLKLDPLIESDLKKIAARQDVKLQFDKTWLLKHAGGSIGQLIHLSSLDAGALHTAVDNVVKQLPAVKWNEVHALAEKVARKEQDAQFRLVLELLNDGVTERMLHSPTALGPLWEEMQSKMRMATERHLDRAATLIDIVACLSRGMQASPHSQA